MLCKGERRSSTRFNHRYRLIQICIRHGEREGYGCGTTASFDHPYRPARFLDYDGATLKDCAIVDVDCPAAQQHSDVPRWSARRILCEGVGRQRV